MDNTESRKGAGTLETHGEGTPGMAPILGQDREGFARLCNGLDLRPFQVEDAYRWVYNRRILDPSEWTTLPRRAREALSGRTVHGLPVVAEESLSIDGTRKFLIRLDDGEYIESVYIPDGDRRTVCLSSQVGCAMGCTFCLTGTLGFRRNLSAGEILGQTFLMEERTDLRERAYNIVFMGMGEPLANLANLRTALKILTDPVGMAISRRRITVSTAGLADAMEELAKDPSCPQISLSLNAAEEGPRRALMPVAERYDLKRLRSVLQGLSTREREWISLEYVLLKGINDRPVDARSLARFASGLKVKVNLIPFNEAPPLPYRTVDMAAVIAFQDILVAYGMQASIRKSRGSDILAACGQLANRRRPSVGGKP